MRLIAINHNWIISQHYELNIIKICAKYGYNSSWTTMYYYYYHEQEYGLNILRDASNELIWRL